MKQKPTPPTKKCGLFQNKTEKKKLRSSTQGHKALARLLSEFANWNVLGFDLASLEAPGLALE